LKKIILLALLFSLSHSISSITLAADVSNTSDTLKTETTTHKDRKVSSGPMDSDAEQLSELLRAFKTLQGDFTQTVSDVDGQVDDPSAGKFSLQKPNLIRWETLQPFPQLLVGNNETLWLYDPELEQVTVRKVDQSQQSPIQLLSGDLSTLEQKFTIAMGVATGASKAPVDHKSFVITPKEEGSLFEKLELQFKQQTLSVMKIYDSLGQITRITINNVKVNQPLAGDLFEFIAPAEADVLVDEQ